MAVETQDSAVERREHIVQFYAHDAELMGAVGPYLAAGVMGGEVAIVIATAVHRRTIDVELRDRGIDLMQAGAGGRFVSLDAATTMALFMNDGEIDREAFHQAIGGRVREACDSGRPVRAYGEMVALLWDAGDVLAAVELERLWNDLARELPFSLFCSYPASSVSGSEHAEVLHTVCDLHSCVLRPAAGGLQVDDCSEADVAAGEFPPALESPGRARRLTIQSLRRRGYDPQVVGDVAIVLSELANNAVLHAGSAFSISVRARDSTLRIAVQDAGRLDTMAPEYGLIVQPGHGLSLIDALATRWGVEEIPAGKVVWAELSVAPASQRHG